MSTFSLNLDIGFNLGFIVGFLIADKEQCEECGLKWGFTIQLGILSVNILSYDPEAFEEEEKNPQE
jgi:hypothetical protein